VEKEIPAIVNSVPVFGAMVKENESVTLSAGSSVAGFGSTVKEREISTIPTESLFGQSKFTKKDRVHYPRFTSSNP